MGGCGSVAESAKVQSEKNRNINKDIAKERRKAEHEIKMLLLGAGESGKSTIAKQMRIIYLSGFLEEERKSYRSIIFSNTISSMRILIEAARDLGIALREENHEIAAKLLGLEEYFSDSMSPEVAGFIKTLWTDPGVQETFSRSAEFQLNDSASYFFGEIDRLAEPNFIPSENDVIRSRAKTTGIIETEFDINDTHFRLVDVGGQRSERKKWMHCFQDVSAVVFCVAMSEYDLKLYEDDSTNRMQESLKLFKEICNNKWFAETSMILFLNKRDLFAKKILQVDLNVCFPEYNGGKNFEPAAEYIQNKFIEKNEVPSKKVFAHMTCATDTDQITRVFTSIKDSLTKDDDQPM
eukprot:TRINITY_DN183_c1_g1_i1.p1 TRINITY_DN183_c1_g1~~TRINITY_DN183_c1_g1_i1.p1  ORF type:complete len:358 (-),score=74.80 TRINITY_DN183_c1_g1_i1:188-1240(-)